MADKTVKKNKILNESKNSKTTLDRGVASTKLGFTLLIIEK